MSTTRALLGAGKPRAPRPMSRSITLHGQWAGPSVTGLDGEWGKRGWVLREKEWARRAQSVRSS